MTAFWFGRISRTVRLCIFGWVTAWLCDLAAGSWNFSYRIKLIIFIVCVFLLTKDTRQLHKAVIAVHIRLFAVLLISVTSQYSKIYLRWMTFNSFPLLVVPCLYPRNNAIDSSFCFFSVAFGLFSFLSLFLYNWKEKCSSSSWLWDLKNSTVFFEIMQCFCFHRYSWDSFSLRGM